jgi:hypothetical protein
MNNLYTGDFYKDQSQGSYNSAKIIIPYIVNLFHPKSVVDMGCGIGTWLKVFSEHGVKDILGVDGKYVNTKQLLIQKNKFVAFDLTKPLKLDRKFDIALSLEVAEHIEEKHSDVFIKSLTSLSDVVVFSAAVPYQRGTNHVNEQLPSYWKSIFEKYNYTMYDVFRGQFWNNENVNTEYKQNMFLYINSSINFSFEKRNIMDFVHPDMLIQSTIVGEKYVNSILEGHFGIKGSFMILLKAIRLYFRRLFNLEKKTVN